VSEDAPGPIPDSPTEVEAIMLLCDSAQSVGGKLYILGGGWSQAPAVAPEALPMGLAIRMLVPWDRTNEHIPVKIRLLTDRGIAVTDAAGAPVEATTALEVGRPPGVATRYRPRCCSGPELHGPHVGGRLLCLGT
jgi:hypothetical protein